MRYDRIKVANVKIVDRALHLQFFAKYDDPYQLELHDYSNCILWSTNTFNEILRSKGGNAASKMKDLHGRCTLHYACCGAPENIIATLLHCNPSAVRKRDESTGNYPLHIACRCHKEDSIVLQLTDLFPAAIAQRNEDGEDPLLLA
jgi:hypothetical protein